ncbi:hypothetical protein [Glutamicibacter sp.]|uniref:hypothetical protein n=1 Tax=Glutamicibacter sp. TaxID=1931995 RepID=UPI0028BF2A7B|nr:hypothetical protein [Glutamicibacter sp.]
MFSGTGDAYWINVEDPASVVGDADYVFVAKVVSQGDAEYDGQVTLETSTGTSTIAAPFTNYTILVQQNLKGSLLTNDSVPVQISGGFSRELNTTVTPDDTMLPEVGRSYVFNAIAQPDGSLLVQGGNSVVPVDDGYAVVDSYVEAVKNQIPTPRERFSSKFEQD